MSILIPIGARFLSVLGSRFAGKILDHLDQRGNRGAAQITVAEIKAHMDVRKTALQAESDARQAARSIILAEQGWWVKP